MMPIRRGDGTGLSVPGFSEVRTGDGTVLWSAGADIPDSVVDDFEDGDIAEYTQDGSNWSVTTSSVIEGSYALSEASGSDAWREPLLSTSGLPDYPQQGDVMSVLLYADSGGPMFYFGLSGGTSDYSCWAVELDTADQLRIIKWTDKSGSSQAEASPSVSSQYYDVEIWWHDGSGSEPEGTIEAKLFEIDETDLTRTSQIESVSYTDTDYAQNTGIGFGRWGTNGSAGIFADAVRVMGQVDEYENPDGVII